jgi:hypothetical protein
VSKNIHWRKDRILNKWCWEKCLFMCKRLKLDPHFSRSTKINSKWLNNLNVRHHTLKLIGKQTLEDIGIGNVFLNKISIAQKIKTRTHHLS